MDLEGDEFFKEKYVVFYVFDRNLHCKFIESYGYLCLHKLQMRGRSCFNFAVEVKIPQTIIYQK